MIRVLHIFHEMENGGIEHFVMEYYRNIDRSRVQFDFLVSTEKKGYFDDEIRKLGGKIYHAYPTLKNPIKNYKDILQIVRNNNYKIVHRHTGSAFGKFDLLAAKWGGASNIILHSHNNSAGNKIIHYLFKYLVPLNCERLACSQEAGEWLFKKNDHFMIIRNAIECSKFGYQKKEANRLKKDFNLEGKFVIGHIGRFENQKNHKFILQILEELIKKDANTMLVSIGEGSLQNSIMDEALKRGISSNILFLNSRDDVNLLINVFDVFILPSLYEGFPFVLVEAQTNGLKCVVSTNVPKECDITGNITFLNLDEPISKWCTAILNSKENSIEREKYMEYMLNKGFDLKTNVEKLCRYYEELNENDKR